MSLATPLTPTEIVAELDRYIVGQQAAKKAGAIALRNRWRRQNLTELSVTMVKAEMAAAVRERAEGLAEERVLDLLLPRRAGEAFSSGTLEEVSPDASRDATRDK